MVAVFLETLNIPHWEVDENLSVGRWIDQKEIFDRSKKNTYFYNLINLQRSEDLTE
jgi:hypothetical protein